MDLTPQPSATPWWSVFDCCLPPSSSAVADDGEQDQEGAPSCSSLKVLTGGTGIGTEWIKSHPDTPATTCADSSLDYSAGEWYYGVFLACFSFSSPKYYVVCDRLALLYSKTPPLIQKELVTSLVKSQP